MLSTSLVLTPLLIYLILGFRLVTDILLVAGLVFFSMGRQEYLTRFRHPNH